VFNLVVSVSVSVSFISNDCDALRFYGCIICIVIAETFFAAMRVT
jgi:hypothetical protein